MAAEGLQEDTIPPAAPRLAITSYGRTDVGMVRKLNEDGFLDQTDAHVWAVADGMGGHDSGDFASQTIVETLGGAFLNPPDDGTAKPPSDRAKAAIGLANKTIYAEAANRGPHTVIGATVVALVIDGTTFHCLWAGDSRLYLLRYHRLFPVSKDHSEVQQLVDAGMLTPGEAKKHPRGNIITRAVGTGPTVELAHVRGQVEPGDTLLICSDGLLRVMEETEIEDILVGASYIDGAINLLIDRSLQRGVDDNVTAVGVRCRAIG